METDGRGIRTRKVTASTHRGEKRDPSQCWAIHRRGEVFELLHWMWTPAWSRRLTAKSRCSSHHALEHPLILVNGRLPECGAA